MTDPAAVDDAAHYIGILEAVVALLAIKCGQNPEALMGNVIESITEQAGMETRDTERIIRTRWTGRALPAKALVTQMLPDFEKPVVTLEETPEPVDWQARYRERRERQKESQTEALDTPVTSDDVSETLSAPTRGNLDGTEPAGQHGDLEKQSD